MEELEIWKPIVGFEKLYEVSNLGRVKALSKKGSKKELIRKTGMDIRNGYVTVMLRKNNIPITRRVHSLVVEGFLGIKTTHKKVCNHKDGIKTNNRLSNLEVISQKENIKHAFLLGLNRLRKEDDNYITKIRKVDYQQFINLCNEGKTNKEIANVFNVNASTVSKIRSGKRRNDVIVIPNESTCNYISEEKKNLAIQLIKQGKKPYFIEKQTTIGRKTKLMKNLMMIYAEQYGNILK